jgi:hypothetical protein
VLIDGNPAMLVYDIELVQLPYSILLKGTGRARVVWLKGFNNSRCFRWDILRLSSKHFGVAFGLYRLLHLGTVREILCGVHDERIHDVVQGGTQIVCEVPG